MPRLRRTLALLALVPLLAAQCWGSCGMTPPPQQQAETNLPPCHAPAQPEKAPTAPAPCCSAATQPTLVESAGFDLNHSPALLPSPVFDPVPTPPLRYTFTNQTQTAHPPPPLLPTVLRI